MSRTFTNDFKRFFGRGLAILLPSIVTLWLLWQAFTFVFKTVATPINAGIRVVIIEAVEVFPEAQRPKWYLVTTEQIDNRKIERQRQGRRVIEDSEIERNIRREQFREFWDDYLLLETTGLFIAIILIYLAGMLLSNFVGRRIYHRVERLIARIPGFKQVYPHVKQVVDLVVGEKKMAFSKVVLVEYPSKDIWTIGFLTGESIRDIDESAGERVQSVFIPTSPTPVTGFTINVSKSKIRQLDMTVEEALRFVITAGVLAPGDVPPRSGESAGKDPARELPEAPKPGPDAEKQRDSA
ncbi:MAG: DUF502 domain-containing protein [Phycisphaerales bacterium JB040]